MNTEERIKRHDENMKILDEVSNRTEAFMDALFEEFIGDLEIPEKSKLWKLIIAEVEANAEMCY
jgi:hypothetical protein